MKIQFGNSIEYWLKTCKNCQSINTSKGCSWLAALKAKLVQVSPMRILNVIWSSLSSWLNVILTTNYGQVQGGRRGQPPNSPFPACKSKVSYNYQSNHVKIKLWIKLPLFYFSKICERKNVAYFYAQQLNLHGQEVVKLVNKSLKLPVHVLPKVLPVSACCSHILPQKI